MQLSMLRQLLSMKLINDFEYEDEWLQDEFVQKMILDVDKSEVLNSGVIKSPILGLIPPTEISGGVKALILIYQISLPY